MARPQKDGMDYFPHDTDAASDEKIEPLLVLYGAKGYALYFYLLERIYRQKDFELDVSDAETIQLLTRKLQITQQEYDSIILTALRHGAFDKQSYEERCVLTSNGIKKRASVVVAKREAMRERELLRQKLPSNKAETNLEIPKVKKSKVKNITLIDTPKKRTIVNEYYDLFFAKYGQKPVITGKHGKLLNDLVKQLSTEEVIGRLKMFFDDTDKFVVDSKHDVSVFQSRVNRYVYVEDKTDPNSEYQKKLRRELDESRRFRSEIHGI